MEEVNNNNSNVPKKGNAIRDVYAWTINEANEMSQKVWKKFSEQNNNVIDGS